ncbi:unnamed protein product [Toxocara canis]|uniref:DUF5641 domain-containing protein n=1 Tax=Toxocara canis TaxID=6265 RepID=A0A183VEE2_TOXCA|nr:unnamed protein product [Toxocara canis]
MLTTSTSGTANKPRVGDAVLIHDESKPRASWKIGIITKLIKRRDGNIRFTELQCKSQRKFVAH